LRSTVKTDYATSEEKHRGQTIHNSHDQVGHSIDPDDCCANECCQHAEGTYEGVVTRDRRCCAVHLPFDCCDAQAEHNCTKDKLAGAGEEVGEHIGCCGVELDAIVRLVVEMSCNQETERNLIEVQAKMYLSRTRDIDMVRLGNGGPPGLSHFMNEGRTGIVAKLTPKAAQHLRRRRHRMLNLKASFDAQAGCVRPGSSSVV